MFDEVDAASVQPADDARQAEFFHARQQAAFERDVPPAMQFLMREMVGIDVDEFPAAEVEFDVAVEPDIVGDAAFSIGIGKIVEYSFFRLAGFDAVETAVAQEIEHVDVYRTGKLHVFQTACL